MRLDVKPEFLRVDVADASSSTSTMHRWCIADLSPRCIAATLPLHRQCVGDASPLRRQCVDYS
eukprot:2513447-Pyramimonas_sp.AAC.1